MSVIEILKEVIVSNGSECVAQPTNEELVEDYYTQVYGVVPIEWRDKDGTLIGMVYKSNSEETRRLWGDSLTIRMDEEEEEEYSDGEAIDDMNERQYYFH